MPENSLGHGAAANVARANEKDRLHLCVNLMNLSRGSGIVNGEIMPCRDGKYRSEKYRVRRQAKRDAAFPRFASEFQGWDTIQSGVALRLPPHSIAYRPCPAVLIGRTHLCIGF